MAILGKKKLPPVEEDKTKEEAINKLNFNSDKIYARIIEKFDDAKWQWTGGNGYVWCPYTENKNIQIYLWDTGYWYLHIEGKDIAKGKDTENLYWAIIRRKVENFLKN